MFLSHNDSLGPPYRILVDTNFINFSLQNKIELVQGMMDCLMAKCIPTITECVLAELEKLGPRYRMALKVARDPRFERLPCAREYPNDFPYILIPHAYMPLRYDLEDETTDAAATQGILER